jgi:GxxExxY protein
MGSFEGVLSPELESIGKTIVNCVYAVHRKLGPGLLEGLYETCLAHELQKQGLMVSRQVSTPVRYDDLLIENGLRIDLLVNDLVIIEVKAVEQIHEVHKAQLLTYLKLAGKPLGYLVNFNVPLIKDGIKRFVRN